MGTSATLPRTPGSAPPNFYSQVGAQGGQPAPGPGAQGPGGQQVGAPPPQPKPQDPDQDFLDSVEKLLVVLNKLGEMQPRGMNVSKYTGAAAQAIKDMSKHVFSGKPAKGTQQTPGTSSAGAQGVGGNDTGTMASAPPSGASASNATGTI